MGSRRCCCGPSVIRCTGCCSDCMTSYKVGRENSVYFENGSPFLSTEPDGIGDPFMPQVPGDEIVVTFGSSPSIINQNAPVKQTYRNIGSYWTWYTAPFMVDFNHNFPSCTSLIKRTFNSVYGAFVEYQTPNVSVDVGDLDNFCYPKNYNDPNAGGGQIGCNINAGLSEYYSAHRACGKPYFDVIQDYDPYGPYGSLQPASPIYGVGLEEDGTDQPPFMPAPNSPFFKIGGSKDFANSYPCSTEDEDTCCRYPDVVYSGVANIKMHIMGPFGNVIQNRPDACNYLGLTKYRRRVLKTWYPWAWQIFSYSLDKLLPFGNETNHWASTGAPTEDGGNPNRLVRVGQPVDLPLAVPTTIYLTALRHQFLGFAICEHHYDRACGCLEKDQTVKPTINLGRHIPRRFIYRCSGIPMFEFDLYEAVKDEVFNSAEVKNFINYFKSFTVWFANPERGPNENIPVTEGTLRAIFEIGGVDPSNVPSIEEITQIRLLFAELMARKYEGLRSTDWRYKATLEIIEANDLYKKAIRKKQLLLNPEHVEYDSAGDPKDYDKVEFDIIEKIGGFNFTINDLKNNPTAYVREIFQTPLGPVRKRCRMNNAPKSQASWNDNGLGILITLTSKFGVNVLVPKTFPLSNTPEPVWLIDEQFIKIQAINWFDLGKPYTEAQSGGDGDIPIFGSSLENPDPENFPEIYWNETELAADLNNKLSHLMHTYFYTQPAGWDWASNGPQLNGNKPQDNWWNRRLAVTPYTTIDIDNIWSYTNPHTPLSRMVGIDYAWNPNANGWFTGLP